MSHPLNEIKQDIFAFCIKKEKEKVLKLFQLNKKKVTLHFASRLQNTSRTQRHSKVFKFLLQNYNSLIVIIVPGFLNLQLKGKFFVSKSWLCPILAKQQPCHNLKVRLRDLKVKFCEKTARLPCNKTSDGPILSCKQAIKKARI